MLLPTNRWSSSYYAPASTTTNNYGSSVFLYNPATNSITVFYDYRSGASNYVTASTNVSAGGNARVTLSSTNAANFGAYHIQQAKLFDPDGDQSGMLVYTLNSRVKIAAVWAQDPTVASAAQPGVDVATLVPPMREGDAGKMSTLAVDADGGEYRSAGDTLEYTINIINTARTPIPGPFTVKDSLSPAVSYVTNSTRYRFSVGGGLGSPGRTWRTMAPARHSRWTVPAMVFRGRSATGSRSKLHSRRPWPSTPICRLAPPTF
jgi:uncharacterized repeat protein (TIGR01451 family)